MSVKNYFRLAAEDRGVKGAEVVSPILGAVSGLYGSAVQLNRNLYDKGFLKRKKLSIPVISVGNLTWGGSGKTPLVEYLARRVCERHKTPMILSRGYGADEVNQLRHQLPKVVVAAGKNRWRKGRETMAKQAVDIAILDDGLQHWPLARDAEIIVVNALNPFGNGRLIPRGILREPMKVLAKATALVITHVNLVPAKELMDLKETLKRYAPEAPIVEAYLEPLFFYRPEKKVRIPIQKLKKHRVTTVAGVGFPKSFQLLLQSNQIRPARNFEFIDHHRFSSDELQEIKRISDTAAVDEIITTEKDYYRAPEMMAQILNPLILATRLRIAAGEDVLINDLSRFLGVGK
ncbi:MAG: tetraacyldisaccharide 4'-kinase [Candidatus Omnitrophica bacterium]|nr:tetraacyldisaccharide 4'-kinase [Candidatus Omnitrophota bacterium]